MRPLRKTPRKERTFRFVPFFQFSLADLCFIGVVCVSTMDSREYQIRTSPLHIDASIKETELLKTMHMIAVQFSIEQWPHFGPTCVQSLVCGCHCKPCKSLLHIGRAVRGSDLRALSNDVVSVSCKAFVPCQQSPPVAATRGSLSDLSTES